MAVMRRLRSLFVVPLAAILLAACGGSPSLDANGKKACAGVARLDAGGDAGAIDQVVDEVLVVTAAAKSTDKALHAAAVKTSSTSKLLPTNPFYENPEDVKYDAVKAWCVVNDK